MNIIPSGVGGSRITRHSHCQRREVFREETSIFGIRKREGRNSHYINKEDSVIPETQVRISTVIDASCANEELKIYMSIKGINEIIKISIIRGREYIGTNTLNILNAIHSVGTRYSNV